MAPKRRTDYQSFRTEVAIVRTVNVADPKVCQYVR